MAKQDWKSQIMEREWYCWDPGAIKRAGGEEMDDPYY
jgi:hypothetical protein